MREYPNPAEIADIGIQHSDIPFAAQSNYFNTMRYEVMKL